MNNDLLRWVFLAAAIPALAFPIAYLRSPWWRHPVGRQIMALALVIAAFFAQGLVALWWPEYPGRAVVRVVLFIALAIVLWWRFILLLVVQHESLRQPATEGSAP